MAQASAGGAWQYHQATKHTPARNRADRFRPDWSDQPRPFKLYRNLPAFPLPAASPPAAIPALEAIAGVARAQPCPLPDLPALAAILGYSAGVIKRLRYARGVMEFRAASSTGALYHLELYLVCGHLPGLDAGVYHFGAVDRTLTRLRAGDWRGALAAATAEEPSAAVAPAFLVCTSTLWRNAWRYRERAFRHAFWDSGTLLANAFAVATARGVPARLLTGFVDDAVSRLLGLDSPREIATCVMALGVDPVHAPRQCPEVPPLHAEAVPESQNERRYPIVEQAQTGTSLATPEALREWRERIAAWPARRAEPAEQGARTRFAPPASLPQMPVEEAIERRRSARRFREATIDGEVLAAMLAAAMRPIPADYAGADDAGSPPRHTPYLIANAVRGLEPGAYIYHMGTQEFELLRAGAFREHAAVLALDQVQAGFAAVNVYFVTDLQALLARTGERGYRVAQLDAAICGGRLYLAATAFGLGVRALTFYDDAVIRFFSPRAAGQEASFLVTLGQPA
jgi:SagB-type dehydrogenase family enzyme